VIPSELTTLDATALAAAVHAGEITATHLTRMTLDRIDMIEPTVNAFRVVMVDQALFDAARIDALTDDVRRGLPLAGVPVAIKDDTDVAGQSTMWGTAIDRGICVDDAVVVSRLRRAGAVIIGKTNVPELTLWPWTASRTWGATRNPWDLERTPGGSSGGSATAVCAGMAAMALGSDGGGSVRYPAALTGLIGIKPQRDRLPLGLEHGSGWHGLIALGPLTRSTRDAALFLDLVSDAEHTTTFRDAVGRRQSLRIAVATNPPAGSQVALSPECRKHLDRAVEMLAALGHEIVVADIDYPLAALWNSTVRLLKGAQHDVASMPDTARLERRTRSVARLGKVLPARSLRKALAREHLVVESINTVFQIADVVLTPICKAPALLVSECPANGAVRSLRAANTSAWLVPWNLTGQPALTLPIGLDDDGLPIAVQLVGRADDEVTLLTLAAELEHHQPFARLPQPPFTD